MLLLMMMMKYIMVHLCVAVNNYNYMLISNLDVIRIIIECVNIVTLKIGTKIENMSINDAI